MTKRKNSKKGVRHFFYYTRPGFYILVLLAIIGFTTTINSLNAAKEEESSVLSAQDNRDKNEEEQREKDERREEHKQEIEQKFRVEPEGLRLDFKPENKRVEKKLEHKTEELSLTEESEEELKDDIIEEFEFENEVKIATDGGIVVSKNKVKARTGFPLSIDVSTGQLTVTRPDGTQKEVAILPDQAVQNFLRHKKIELITPEAPDENEDSEAGTESAEANIVEIQSIDDEIEQTENETETEIEIVERNNQLVYEIKGKKKIRILGLIPVKTSLSGYVSTETGEVVGESQPFFDSLLNLISIQQ